MTNPTTEETTMTTTTFSPATEAKLTEQFAALAAWVAGKMAEAEANGATEAEALDAALALADEAIAAAVKRRQRAKNVAIAERVLAEKMERAAAVQRYVTERAEAGEFHTASEFARHLAYLLSEAGTAATVLENLTDGDQ